MCSPEVRERLLPVLKSYENRGYTNSKGEHRPNYHYEDITLLCDKYESMPELTNPAVIIDTNHENSGKNYMEQPRILREVMNNRRYNERIRRRTRR